MMTFGYWPFVIAAFAVPALLFTYCLCKISSNCSREEERWPEPPEDRVEDFSFPDHWPKQVIDIITSESPSAAPLMPPIRKTTVDGMCGPFESWNPVWTPVYKTKVETVYKKYNHKLRRQYIPRYITK
jgi:hypothetical protein